MNSRIFLSFFGLFFGLLFSLETLAQFPEGISYQAVARNDLGVEMTNADIEVRISIRYAAFDGIIQWQEQYTLTTDQFGLFSLIIGEGTPTGDGAVGSFEEIPWGDGLHFMQVELYWLNEWLDMGTSQFMSTPYALHAKTAENVDDADANIGNELITTISLLESDLNIVEGPNAFVVDMSGLIQDSDWDTLGMVVYTQDKWVGIETSTPNSHLDVKGSMSLAVESVSGPFMMNLNEDHHVIIADISAGNVTLTLPIANACIGRMYKVKTVNPSNGLFQLIINPSVGDTIDGSTSLSFDQNDHPVSLISNGNNWYVLSGNYAP